MWLHSLEEPEVVANLRWEEWCMWSMYCSMSFLTSPTHRLSFSHYKYNCTLKMEAETCSETLAPLHQNSPSRPSAAGHFSYNIKINWNGQLTSFMLRHDVTSVRSDLSVTRTHTHAQCLFSESGLITQQSWENCQSSACCTSYCVPTIYIIY